MIGAEETVRVRYHKNQPHVESERRAHPARRVTPSREVAGRSSQGRRHSSAKREERERRQRAIRARRIGLVLLAAVVCGLVVWGVVALINSPVFRVTSVVVTGTAHLDEADVISLARVGANETLLTLSKRGIEKRLSKSPWIRDARVSRQFPDTVRIEVSERAALAAVDMGGTDFYVVSKDGYWLGERSAEESGVPIIREVEEQPAPGEPVKSRELRNAISVVRGLSPELLVMTRVIVAPSVEKTAIITTDDVEIYIGEAEGVADKDRIARQILAEHQGKVVYINVRVVESPTWRGLDE